MTLHFILKKTILSKVEVKVIKKKKNIYIYIYYNLIIINIFRIEWLHTNKSKVCCSKQSVTLWYSLGFGQILNQMVLVALKVAVPGLN